MCSLMDVGRRAVEIRREIESDMAFGLFSSAASVLSVPTPVEIEQSEPPVILPKALLEGAEKLPAEKIDAAVLQAVKESGATNPYPLSDPRFEPNLLSQLSQFGGQQWRGITI